VLVRIDELLGNGFGGPALVYTHTPPPGMNHTGTHHFTAGKA
jgi:hypothetical protein